MAELLKKKKHINVITAEFKTYWEQLFIDNGIENPLFNAKLCYQGSEFESVDGRKSECIRFFPSELSKGQDVFIEMFDWFDNPYEQGYRNLYVLKNKPDWKTALNFCVEVTLKNDGTFKEQNLNGRLLASRGAQYSTSHEYFKHKMNQNNYQI
jgi:hypothetical protein